MPLQTSFSFNEHVFYIVRSSIDSYYLLHFPFYTDTRSYTISIINIIPPKPKRIFIHPHRTLQPLIIPPPKPVPHPSSPRKILRLIPFLQIPYHSRQLFLQILDPLINNFVGRDLAYRLDFKIEFPGFGVVVEGFVWEGGVFPFCVAGGRPFCLGVDFVPEGCVAEFIVGVVFEGDGCDGGPFCVFFCDALKRALVYRSFFLGWRGCTFLAMHFMRSS
jgi:hypothetical protein